MLNTLWNDLSRERQSAFMLIQGPEALDDISIRRLESRAASLSNESIQRLSRLLAFAIGKYETQTQLAKRLEISLSKLRRRFESEFKPACDAERGAGGRIVHIRSNPLLDAFLVGARHPVSELASKIFVIAPRSRHKSRKRP